MTSAYLDKPKRPYREALLEAIASTKYDIALLEGFDTMPSNWQRRMIALERRLTSLLDELEDFETLAAEVRTATALNDTRPTLKVEEF